MYGRYRNIGIYFLNIDINIDGSAEKRQICILKRHIVKLEESFHKN